MDTKLCALCVLAVLLSLLGSSLQVQMQPRGDTETEPQLPPMIFPTIPQSPGTEGGLEVPDLLKPIPESEKVDHPNKIDPGTTHQEGGMNPNSNTATTNKPNQALTLNPANMTRAKKNSMFSRFNVAAAGKNNTLNVINMTNTENNNTINTTNVASNPDKNRTFNSTNVTNAENNNNNTTSPKTGVIYTCNFPKSWLKQAGSWVKKSDNDSNVCSFPPEWFKETSNDTLHICTIHKEWLRTNNYTIQNGTIPKELLADMNSNNFSCVTPKDALKDNLNNDTTHYSTIPRAWLREGNDIYIYLVPEDGLVNITQETTKLDNNTNTTTMDANDSKIPNSTETPSRVSITSDSTIVKVVTDTATLKATNIPSTVEITTQKPSPPSSTMSVEVETQPKLNTPVKEEPINKNQTNNNDVDKNRANTPDVNGETTTPASPAALLQRHSEHDHSSSTGKTAFLQPTESAAILAGVFVAIALLGYVGLLVWRRILERRYGNRQMLVNEDDDFDTSDMRHFEMQTTRSPSSIIIT